MTATTMERPAVPPQAQAAPASIPVSGLVDIGDGRAFVRTCGYRHGSADVSVSAGQIRQYGLRKGDRIEGTGRPAGRGQAGRRTGEGSLRWPSS